MRAIKVQIQDRSSVRLRAGMLKALAAKVLSDLGYPEAGLQIALVSETRICELHRQLFEDSSSTNVISLEYGLPPAYPGECIGEVHICSAVAAREARSAGIDPLHRVGQLLIHGILHVCGYEHVGVTAAARRQMQRMEKKLDDQVLRPMLGESAAG